MNSNILNKLMLNFYSCLTNSFVYVKHKSFTQLHMQKFSYSIKIISSLFSLYYCIKVNSFNEYGNINSAPPTYVTNDYQNINFLINMYVHTFDHQNLIYNIEAMSTAGWYYNFSTQFSYWFENIVILLLIVEFISVCYIRKINFYTSRDGLG